MSENEHATVVTAWFARLPPSLSSAEELALLERAVAAVWGRACQTLGETTIAAITDRVLSVTAARFPLLSGLAIDGCGIGWDSLSAHGSDLSRVEIRSAVEVVLVEFIQVVSNLTADILAPALHAELAGIQAEQGADAEPRSDTAPPSTRRRTQGGKGARS